MKLATMLALTAGLFLAACADAESTTGNTSWQDSRSPHWSAAAREARMKRGH